MAEDSEQLEQDKIQENSELGWIFSPPRSLNRFSIPQKNIHGREVLSSLFNCNKEHAVNKRCFQKHLEMFPTPSRDCDSCCECFAASKKKREKM